MKEDEDMECPQLGMFDAALDVIVDPTTVTVTPQACGPTIPDMISIVASALRNTALRERDLFALLEPLNVTDAQEVYNILEGSVVQLLREGSEPAALLAKCPTQRRRTLAKEDLQQFSTPPTLGALAARSANLGEDDVLCEPSAGTGMLVATAPCELLLNEIDRHRRSILRANFPKALITSHDACYIDAVVRGKRPTVILTNPPFSVDLHGDDGTKVGIEHVLAALRLLQSGGRLVAVLGHNQHPQLKSWVPADASLRIAVTVDGKDYGRMGTTFDSCLVVIDKGLNLPLDVASTEPRAVSDLATLLPVLPRLRISGSATSTVTTLTQRKRNSGATYYTPIFDGAKKLEYRYEAPSDAVVEGRFVTWQPHLHFPDARPHPARLVESAALGGVRLPSPATEVALTENAIAALSNAQLETLVYTLRSFERTFVQTIERDPDEPVDEDDENSKGRIRSVSMRGGMLVGHGTGFGKGRFAASVILANMLAGRTKAVWVTENQLLFEDTLRDWVAVAGKQAAGALMNLSEYNVRDTIAAKHGILFCTYATMRNEAKQTSRSRLDQILEFLGPDFDGAIVFDEAHNLANVLVTKGSRGKQGGSKQGYAALTLQNRVPNARILYMTATCASKIEAFAYAPRLGLWGEGAPFATREKFLQTIGEGGVGALELLCRDLKAQGRYLATTLSLAGVEINRLEHELDGEQIDGYNALAGSWRIIKEKLDELVKDYDSRSRSAARGAIAGAEQRSLQSYLITASLPTVIPYMHERLDAGEACVVQFTNTYEAAQERALGQLESLDDLEQLDCSPKQIIIDYLDTVFPTMKTYTEVDGESGQERTRILQDGEGRYVADPEKVAVRDELKAKLAALVVPDAPLTILLETFGSERIAEVTGRKRRVTRQQVDGQWQRIIEERPDDASSRDTLAFMNGEKDILLFSEGAGGTGRSYHADRAAVNQKRRNHLLLQTGWRSDRAIQGLGRTLRSNSVSNPIWTLITTNVPGQRRFISTIARRLEELGAASRGQRDAAGTGLFSASDNLETIYGQLAVTSIIHDIALNNTPLTYETWLAQTHLKLLRDTDQGQEVVAMNVPRFMNQVLTCDVGNDDSNPQHVLMNELLTRMSNQVKIAKQNGTFDYGLTDLRALKTAVKNYEALRTDEEGNETVLYTLNITRKAKRHSFGDALSQVRKSREKWGEQEAFFTTYEGSICAIYRVANASEGGKPQACYTYMTPGATQTVIPRFSPRYGNRHVDEDKAAAAWASALAGLGETTDSNGYVLTGTLLPIYALLPETRVRVVRVKTDDGQLIVGRVLKDQDVQELRNALGLAVEQDLNGIIESVLKGTTAFFDRKRWTLGRSYLNYQPRIELTVPDWERSNISRTMQQSGMDVERINFKVRFFAPKTNAHAALERALSGHIFCGFDKVVRSA